MAQFLASAARAMLIAGMAGLFMAYVGAFGTGSAPLATRLIYWLCTMVGSSLVGVSIFAPVEQRGLLDGRPLMGVAVLSVVMSLPLTVLVWFLTSSMLGNPPRMNLRYLPGVFPPVLLISVIMTAINYLVATRTPRHHETHAAPTGSPPPKFLERIPMKLRGGELYAVQAEDHYLRVYTSEGSDLILLRLADAVAELDGIEGAQTHRSWWVAKGAVTNAKRADGRAVLTLKNAVEAPVSRSYAGALRDAGWF